MSPSPVDQIANAVLYEGYILYPYRASSGKNRQRFTFGRVYPEDYSAAQGGAEPCAQQTECLVRKIGEPPLRISVSVRFLHPMWREVGVLAAPQSEWSDDPPPTFRIVPERRVNGTLFQTWQEAVEREISIPLQSLETPAGHHPFSFPKSCVVEPIRNEQGVVTAVLQRRQEALSGRIEISAAVVDAQVWKLTVRVLNQTPLTAAECDDPDAVLMRTLASTHTILRVQGGEFLSQTDPPPEYAEAAAACRNLGAWPVLVGDEARGERDTLLSSPIILPDYPSIAAESPGDLFDGTEIDEILTLRIQTMTDDEKSEMRHVDAYARRILERTETLAEDQLARMHGTLRNLRSIDEEFFNPTTRLESVSVHGISLRPGDRVRIRPKGRADVMDLALTGKTAVIEAIEQNTEDQVHLALVIEDDPGKDLGLLRQSGHRFFYQPDEVEPLEARV